MQALSLKRFKHDTLLFHNASSTTHSKDLAREGDDNFSKSPLGALRLDLQY